MKYVQIRFGFDDEKRLKELTFFENDFSADYKDEFALLGSLAEVIVKTLNDRYQKQHGEPRFLAQEKRN